MFGLSDASQVALIVTAGSIVVGGIPILNVIVNRAVSAGSDKVSKLNTDEHRANAAKLDSIATAVTTHGETLGRVEGVVLRQSEVLADHLSWHLHSPLVSVPPLKDHSA